MKFRIFNTSLALTLAAITSLVSIQLLAASDDKQAKQNERANSSESHAQKYFDKDHKMLVKNYFNEASRQGHCPPGLAKKNNGCNPPGQAKRWQIGQNLQEHVNYYGLPADLSRLLGQPQPGYHYGMVDSDILLLLDGTELVIDAITNLGQ